MFDDILGPVEEEIKIDPKRKKRKRPTLAARKKAKTTSRPIPIPTPVAVDEDDDELCSVCGQDWEDCECEDLSDLLDESDLVELEEDGDPWGNVEPDCNPDDACETGHDDDGCNGCAGI